MAEAWQLGAAAAARAIAQGELAPSALVEALLERSRRVDPAVRAWVRLSERAREDAALLGAEAEAGRLRGPLHGVPLGIKDILYTANLETNVGSPLLAGFVPGEDAACVARLRRAGAIVLGKTAMTEFAAMDPAPTRNPWNLEHTPGGSSSGSAAAVAACLVPGAVGTQTAGSIVRPAAYCGIVGLKPTYDAVERAGAYPCAWSMDHVGPMARSVGDVALLYRAMRAAAAPAAAAPSGAPRIAVADRYFGAQADADTLRAFEDAVRALREAGACIETRALPPSFEAGVDAGILIMYAEMAAVHRERFAAQRAGYGWRLACLLDAGGEVAAADYLRAQQVRRIFAAELSALLAEVDCLMTPSTPAPAPRGLDATGDWTHNLPFSASGHPALTLPIALSPAGMPIGVQLAARHGGEEILFHCGSLLERRVRFPSCPPCP